MLSHSREDLKKGGNYILALWIKVFWKIDFIAAGGKGLKCCILHAGEQKMHLIHFNTNFNQVRRLLSWLLNVNYNYVYKAFLFCNFKMLNTKYWLINNDLEVAHPHSEIRSSSTWFLVELEFGNAGFWGEEKTGVPGEKPCGAKQRTNNKQTSFTWTN